MANSGRFETESNIREEKPTGQQHTAAEHLDCAGSTLMEDATYNYTTKELRITFRSTHHTHSYANVPADVWERVCISPSKGAAFIRLVRNGGYENHLVD